MRLHPRLPARVAFCLACLGIVLAGCVASPTPIVGCDSAHGIVPHCKFANPEDLALLPSGDRLIVSQMGRGMDGETPGKLVTFALPNGLPEPAFPVPGATVADDRRWGDPTCPPPRAEAFSPHGIDLETRADGSVMLLAINHGGREAVEFFEVTETAGAVRLAWRGCALAPDDSGFNDVVARRDGGFWVTRMGPKHGMLGATLGAVLLGRTTGHVWAWTPLEGFTPVPGSEGRMPNGVEKSPDETHLFVNMYAGGEVRKIEAATGRLAGSADVERPDNSTWTSDGRLLVASHPAGFLALNACRALESGSCGFRFEIVAVDPETLATSVVFGHRGAPMGGATVALEVGDELYLGTFAGDRVARTAMPR